VQQHQQIEQALVESVYLDLLRSKDAVERLAPRRGDADARSCVGARARQVKGYQGGVYRGLKGCWVDEPLGALMLHSAKVDICGRGLGEAVHDRRQPIADPLDVAGAVDRDRRRQSGGVIGQGIVGSRLDLVGEPRQIPEVLCGYVEDCLLGKGAHGRLSVARPGGLLE
jgi:hypothetical protein